MGARGGPHKSVPGQTRANSKRPAQLHERQKNAKKLWHTWAQGISESRSDITALTAKTGTPKKEPKTHIDHVWVSNDLMKRNCITDYVVAQHKVANTDHRPLLITLDMTEMLGLNTTTRSVVSTDKRNLKYKTEEQRERYAGLFSDSINNSDLRKMAEHATSNPAEVTKGKMDEIMGILLKSIMGSDSELDRTPKSATNRKVKQGYSHKTHRHKIRYYSVIVV